MANTKIRVANHEFIRSRQAWGNSDRVQTIPTLQGGKRFASPASAQQWVRRHSASILPAVWGSNVTLGEAWAMGLLEVVSC